MVRRGKKVEVITVPTKRAAAQRNRRKMRPVLQAMPSQMRQRVGQRSRNQGTISNIMQSELQQPTSTPEGMAVVRLAVDPFISAGSQSHVLGWPDGVSQPSVAPHFFGELADVSVISGNYSGITPFPNMADKTDVWNYIQLYDADVGVLNECFYRGDLATTEEITFRTQRTEYALKVLNKSSDYTASRLWSAGFTTEFIGTITTDAGKSTVVQVPGNAKLVGPFEDVAGTTVFSYHVNLLGVDDPMVGDRVTAAQMLTETLPNTDSRRYRTEAKLGHCSVIKTSRSELPYDNFEHADTGITVSQAWYYNPLYDAFFGASDAPLSGTGTGTRVRIPFDIPAQRKHTLMVAHYQGLSPFSAFRIKTYEFVENTVALNSILQPYTRDGLMIDREATDLVAAIHTKMESAYPASFNFFGKIWKGIKKGFGWVNDKIMDPVEDILRGIPGAGKIVEPLEKIREGIFKPIIGGRGRRGQMEKMPMVRQLFGGLNAKSVLNNLSRLAITMMFLFTIVDAQPQQVIVCNNPATPGICNPALPAFVEDDSVVAAIDGLGEGDQTLLTDINNNLKTADGFSRAIGLGLFIDGNAAYPLLPRIRNELIDMRAQNDVIIENLVSQAAALNTLVGLFNDMLLDTTPSGKVLRVGVAANFVRNAHYNDPVWTTPIVFADSNYETCFQTTLSDEVCADGYVPFAFKTGFYTTFDGNRVIAPLPVASENPFAFAADVSLGV